MLVWQHFIGLHRETTLEKYHIAIIRWKNIIFQYHIRISKCPVTVKNYKGKWNLYEFYFSLNLHLWSERGIRTMQSKILQLLGNEDHVLNSCGFGVA